MLLVGEIQPPTALTNDRLPNSHGISVDRSAYQSVTGHGLKITALYRLWYGMSIPVYSNSKLLQYKQLQVE